MVNRKNRRAVPQVGCLTPEGAKPMAAAMTRHPISNSTALLQTLGAYGIWGLLPLFFKQIPTVSPWEVVGERILFSLLLILVVLALRRSLGELLGLLRQPRVLLALGTSSLLIASNWLIYIWAISESHIVAASLGYFLNPLINVLQGVTMLRERLDRVQATAIGVAAMGVALLAAGSLDTLMLSLALAWSFALYGLIRKLTPVPPLAGLGVETLILSLPAAGLLIWLDGNAGLAFGHETRTSMLLVLTGAITTVPLVLFASGARHLSMVTLGLLQYLAPTVQFLLGVLLYGETLSPTRWASFALVWAGLAIFVVHALRRHRREEPMAPV